MCMPHHGTASQRQVGTARCTLHIARCRLAAGESHSLALSDRGMVFSWGSSAYGALGLGETMSADTPMLVDGLPEVAISAIAAGEHHSAALLAHAPSKLWTWGRGR